MAASPIDVKRNAWSVAAGNVDEASSRLALIEAELALLRQAAVPDAAKIAARTADRDKAAKDVIGFRAAERKARAELQAAVNDTLPPRQKFAPLFGNIPVVFLPVRIETRFERRPPNAPTTWRPSLMVRIYPDELEVSTHEKPLTAAEVAAGIEYWTATRAVPADEAQAWRKLLMTYPSPRAAWIVLSTEKSIAGNFSTYPPMRSTSWARPALARFMPDCFVVRGYIAGALAVEVIGKAVMDPLSVSFDPTADPNDPNEVMDISGQGLEIDRDLAWTLDFNIAEQNGMAVRLPPQTGPQNGYDELIVVGLKGSLNPGSAAEMLPELFRDHHYSRGFAFPRLGTATKNTSEARSGHPLPDVGGARSFPIERRAPLTVPDGNGIHFAHALGIMENVADHVENADLREQANARAFNEALWPATLGYFLRQMLSPLFTPAEVEEVRKYFIQYVRGRGPLPAIRIGKQPYGVLPVAALRRWKLTNSTFSTRLLTELQKMLALWDSKVADVPRVGRTTDAEADLLAMLAMDGRSRSVNVRPAMGPVAQWNLLTFLGIAPQAWQTARSTNAQAAFTAIGRPQWDALIGWMSFDAQADRYAFELVTPNPTERDPLPFNYIRWLRTASVAALQAETFPAGVQRPTALLYHVLRHALLHEYLRLANLILGTPPRRPDEELIGFGGAGAAPGAFQLLSMKVAPLTGTRTIGEYLLDPANASGLYSAEPYRASLKAIEDLPTAELERLFTETLDISSHRLDAWATSVAYERLAEIRVRSSISAWIACYGWVEKITYAARQPVPQTLPDQRVAMVQSSGGGHIHGPSMMHASSAAALCNAALTRAGTLDLSSDRVRKALQVLDAVRDGEMLGSVLGGQFERALRDRGPHPDLQKAIDGLRNLYPLVANKLVDSHLPPYSVAARNVVDGLHLYEAVRDGKLVVNTLTFSVALNPAIDAEVRALGDTIDAITELLTAESVFQSMRGNHSAAAASIETLSRGVRPPEIEIAKQPRGGTTMTHRFAVILGESQPAAPGWTAAASPRSSASPFLDAWIGRLLGNPASIQCKVSWASTSRIITLAQLQVRPIDLLAMTPSELELRVAAAAQAPLDADVTIDNTPWPNRAIRNLAETIDTCDALRNLIQSARPLRPEDLVGTESGTRAAPAFAPQAMTRANASRGLLGALRNNLDNAVANVRSSGANADLTPLRAQLAAASLFGFSNAYAASRYTAAAPMLESAASVRAELVRRIQDAATKTVPEEITRAVFGRDFVFLSEFKPWKPMELGQALAQSASLIGDPAAARRWLQSAVPVRPALQRWRSAAMSANAFGYGNAALDVVQMPFTPNAQWVALPFATETQRPPSGRTSIVLHRAAAPAPTANWAGLLIDEWSEMIPSATEQTAVSLPYDSPRAEAPQAILVGVPPPRPGGIASWDYDLAFDTVREAFQLARIRAVDAQLLGSIGQLVPPICLASNADKETISTDLASMLVKVP